MDIKEGKRRFDFQGGSEPSIEPVKLLIIDDAGPVRPELFGRERPANDVVLIAQDKPGLPADSFKKWKPDIEIKPGEMWPDGKVRPHKIKAASGETIWLTVEEYDALVLEARHRARANKVGPSTAPRPLLSAGELVTPIYPDEPDKDGWPDFTVRKIKADGRVILESLHDDLGDLKPGVTLRIREQDYDVLRASGATATIRLRRIAA
jgi:hypothetical protein